MGANCFCLEIDGDKRRIINFDADFFNWGDEEIVIVVFADDTRKKLHKWFAADGCAKVEPSSIACNSHVQVTAKWRVPQMHGWWAFF